MTEMMQSTPRTGVLHLAVVGAITFAAIYTLCWTAAVLELAGASHLYLSMFTRGETSSLTALGWGVCMSLGAGAVIGAIVAVCYNFFRFLAPK